MRFPDKKAVHQWPNLVSQPPGMTNSSPSPTPLWREIARPAVVVGALGYFVDIYDLILFSIVRTASLKSLGYDGQDLVSHGILLLNLQMIGMLIGGILWGIWGDRRGRVQILFGSILLYSVANIANGMVQSIDAYAFWRLVAGVGLAGELGGSITLVSEVLSKELRGYGTTVVATVGVFGAVVGGLVADLVDWRTAYYIGGGLGLGLLALRLGVLESGMFLQLKHAPAAISRGNFPSLFTNGRRFLKYLRCILIGVPSWFVVAVLVTFSPEFAKALNIQGPVKASLAVLFVYLGLTVGDLLSGVLSQRLRSRKKIVFAFVLFTLALTGIYFGASGRSSTLFYAVITLLGIGIGYWAIFVTIAAEQFGTNIRATVATTVPNFVRGAVVPITLAFQFFKTQFGILPGGLLVGIVCMSIALLALLGMEETFGKDLNYEEPA
jgi:MFS family permease